MKKTLFFALAIVASLSISHAATTITAANAQAGTTGFAQQVLLNGAAFTGGTIQIGTFTTTTGLGDISTNVSNLSAFGWTAFGSTAFSTNATAPGIFGAIGGTGVTATLPESNTGPLVGAAIYAIVSNGAGEYIIWNSGKTFAAEVPGVGGAAVSFFTKDITLVRGTIVPGGTKGLGGALVSSNGKDAVTFLAIPEPSSVILGAFGVLGLIRRRRN